MHGRISSVSPFNAALIGAGVRAPLAGPVINAPLMTPLARTSMLPLSAKPLAASAPALPAASRLLASLTPQPAPIEASTAYADAPSVAETETMKWQRFFDAAAPQGSENTIPEPNIGQLRALTDARGIFEHATYTEPNKTHGYASEDVGRALVASLMFNQQRANDPTAAALARTYMDYLQQAQIHNGEFRHRLSADGVWSQDLVTDDAYGRVLWGLGYAAAHPLDADMGARAAKMFDRALSRAERQKWPRALAYSMLGLDHYLERFPDSPRVKKLLIRSADKLLRFYKDNASEDWQWFEEVATYDNAKMPQALFLAYKHTGKKKYLAVAQKTLDFLIRTNFPDDGMLRVIGNKGWYRRGGKPALYDQQPIDAAGMVEALAEAYRCTGLSGYSDKMKTAFAWFLGRNILGLQIYDPTTGGSRDGLNKGKRNDNQGAESSIEFMISQLTMLQILAPGR
jgi:hypothetical protein